MTEIRGDREGSLLVVGAGLSGLAAAVSLAAAGFRVLVLRDSTDRASTALNITGHGIAALSVLGVLDEASASAVVLRDSHLMGLYNSLGESLPMPMPPQRQPGMPAALIIHRPELVRVLTDRAVSAGVEFRDSVSVTALDEQTDAVAVTLSDGTTSTVERFDGVIGADGIRSTVRALLFGDAGAPEYTGQMGLRWSSTGAQQGNLAARPGFYNSLTAPFVSVSLLPGDTAYLEAGVDTDERQISSARARELLRGVLGHYEAPYLQSLLARLSAAETVTARPYESVRLDRDWFVGRVMLIGDAAHATTQDLPVGGVLALEDGIVLGEELGRSQTVALGYAAFMGRRRERVDTVVDTSLSLRQLERSGVTLGERATVRQRALVALSRPY